MTKVAEVMTRGVQAIAPDDTIRRAAELMDELNVGALPVCDGVRLKGVVTDRDIMVRAISVGKDSSCAVQEVASEPVEWCFENDEIEDAMRRMERLQIRRMPVVDSEKQLVGMLSLGDIAAWSDGEVASTIGAISAPSVPDR
ncbi:CBS domain-containing protein [Caballeronia calidae]|uniref:CBS domain-containing protein n=1 Tax=Caballeronia calidae TaxID=1777139 RepID=A0A158DCQ5_9BURK|nr:CBS domain-containing protein [Caballeronia calidae]SAK92359.1 CBS domain-containing protein [Caballeronia calidae]